MLSRLPLVRRFVERRSDRFWREVHAAAHQALHRDTELFYTLSPGLLIALHRAVAIQREAKMLDRHAYYEFGIFRGFALWYMEQLTRGVPDFALHGFDSFAGLPDTRTSDEPDWWRPGTYAAPQVWVEEALRGHGADLTRIRLHPGFFSEAHLAGLTATFAPASIVVIDCDLYASTVPVLRFIRPRLRPGTLMLFDDWTWPGAPEESGEQRALRESGIGVEPLFGFTTSGAHLGSQAFRVTH